MDKIFIINALRKGEIDLKGQFLMGSNYTFLVGLNYQDQSMVAVYKPVRGEQPLWDFPEGTLAKREVAAYLLSEILGWELVPPTVFRRQAPLGAGSLQFFIDHDPEYHYFNFSDEDRQRLRPMAVFDLLLNNADRKGSHILRDAENHLWLIDHGVCFHTDDKLRSVVWDFSGEALPENLVTELYQLVVDLQNMEIRPVKELYKMLIDSEVNGIIRRAQRLLNSKKFPHPSKSTRPYPWPPI